jgi:hypothetical protein
MARKAVIAWPWAIVFHVEAVKNESGTHRAKTQKIPTKMKTPENFPSCSRGKLERILCGVRLVPGAGDGSTAGLEGGFMPTLDSDGARRLLVSGIC